MGNPRTKLQQPRNATVKQKGQNGGSSGGKAFEEEEEEEGGVFSRMVVQRVGA